jgi:hypothetical protein
VRRAAADLASKDRVKFGVEDAALPGRRVVGQDRLLSGAGAHSDLGAAVDVEGLVGSVECDCVHRPGDARCCVRPPSVESVKITTAPERITERTWRSSMQPMPEAPMAVARYWGHRMLGAATLGR